MNARRIDVTISKESPLAEALRNSNATADVAVLINGQPYAALWYSEEGDRIKATLVPSKSPEIAN